VNRHGSPRDLPHSPDNISLTNILSAKNIHNPMSLSDEMFKSADWMQKYKKISGETSSTNIPYSQNQSLINLSQSGLGIGKVSQQNLNRSVLRFDQGYESEYIMPGNPFYKKPRKII